MEVVIITDFLLCGGQTQHMQNSQKAMRLEGGIGCEVLFHRRATRPEERATKLFEERGTLA